MGGLGIAVGAAALWRVEVDGDSMAPTLLAGDRLLAVRWTAVRTGAIVAAPDPRDHRRTLVKRVRSVDGDRLDLRGDAPARSTDSRTFGPVPRRTAARVVYRYAPPDRVGRLPG